MRRDLSALALIATILAPGCQQSQVPQKPAAEQQQYAAARALADKYKKADIAGKEAILRELFPEKREGKSIFHKEFVGLVPASYEYRGKAGETFAGIYVGIEGSVGVYDRTGPIKNTFVLDNEPVDITELDGKVVPGSPWSSPFRLHIPRGHSALFTEGSQFNGKSIDPMVRALNAFSEKFPWVDFSRYEAKIVKDALTSKYGTPTTK